MTPDERAALVYDELDTIARCADSYELGLPGDDAEGITAIAAAIRDAAAREREACAAAVQSQATADAAARRAEHEADPKTVDRYWLGWDDAIEDAVAAIRGRSD